MGIIEKLKGYGRGLGIGGESFGTDSVFCNSDIERLAVCEETFFRYSTVASFSAKITLRVADQFSLHLQFTTLNNPSIFAL